MLIFSPRGNIRGSQKPMRGGLCFFARSSEESELEWGNQEPTAEHACVSLRNTLLLALAGAYANSVACGFAYGRGNQEFELPLLNWLRNPNLYPQDAVRDAFARFPTVFWPFVAYVSHWLSTEKVVFLLFVLTKLLFFLALAFILRPRIRSAGLFACILLSVALSPFLNDLTPLGASDILDSTQTQTSLAIAVLLWAAWFLLERRWIPAAVLCALTVYISALFFVFMLFAFAFFVVLDWRRHQNAIVWAGLLGGAISVPWLVLFHGISYREFPGGYVEALLAFFPFHLTLGSHDAYELISGVGLVVAAGMMVVIARKSGQLRDLRFEILTASFLLPVSLGALFGAIHLTPALARLQMLRADSFLILFSTLLIQVYAANLLHVQQRGPAATIFFCAFALLLPLADSLGLLWPLYIGMLLWRVGPEWFEDFCKTIARSKGIRLVISSMLLVGMGLAAKTEADWSASVLLLLLVIGGCFFAYAHSGEVSAVRIGKLATAVSALGILAMSFGNVPSWTSLWNPVVALTPMEKDWRATQEWAKENTPRDTQFLVPTYPGGFRTFSERSSWGEWKDGQAMYHYPPFADEYRRRMEAVGYPWDKWKGTGAISGNYKRLSWERLLELARQNHLSYIIQFREVVYPSAPVFTNQHYAVYKVVF